MSVFLQIFLLCNVFLMGVLTTIGVQHARAHFRPKKIERPKPVDARLPSEVREALLAKSQDRFENVLEHSATELQRSLDETGTQLTKTLNRLGTAIVGNELERYHADLEQIRKSAEAAISGAQTDLAAHQADLKAKMAADVEAEKQRLLAAVTADHELLTKQIDTRLGDAVAAFLTETMGHEVDLGAQAPYLTKMLEEHKEDLKREVTA